MEEPIKVDTAVLARDKGFNIMCKSYYRDLSLDLNNKKIGKFIDKEEIIYDEDDGWMVFDYRKDHYIPIEFDSFAFAPTQTELQTWLREVHTIYVLMDNYNDLNGNHLGWKYKIFKDNKLVDSMGGISEYENMLEYGLKKGLELIKL